MKSIFVLFLIIAVLTAGCAVFLACDAEPDRQKPTRIEEGMSAEDIFDLLDRSFSYTIVAGDEFYRFVKGKGYSKLEEGVFDGLLASGNVGYRYHKEPMEMVETTEVALNDAFFKEIDDMYDHYVQLLRESFENMQSKDPVAFETMDDGYRAIIKIIMNKGEGNFSVITCEICNVNCTELIFPD